MTASLPKLIKLSPAVVKEVFSRIWSKGPLSPADLLIALHKYDRSLFCYFIQLSSDKLAIEIDSFFIFAAL